MVTYDGIRHDFAVNTYIEEADRALGALGYTEHSFAHVTRVAETAGRLLEQLGYGARAAELARIAGYLHDIGNLVNRVDHSQSGAVMAFRILDKAGMDARDLAAVVSAIGNHDEGSGVPVNPIAAALILADKSDVRRTRVRNRDRSTFDIHDRVNYSVKKSQVLLDKDEQSITLELETDEAYGSISDYFEIFLGRMIMCRKAAETLALHFHLVINRQVLM